MNKTHEVLIYDNDNMGNGITKINNKICFVKASLKDERLLINIVKESKKYSFGEILKILEPSKERTKIKCPYYNDCGGCSFLHTNYQNELKLKENYVNKLFNTNKKINYLNEYNYRNKVTLHVKNNKIGFYKAKTNDLIEIDNCLLLNDKINEIISVIKTINLKEINKIIIRYAVNTNEMIISFDGIIANQDINLITKNKYVKSIYSCFKKVYGSDYIIETIGKTKYAISPNSFFQVNTKMMVKLYDEIKKINKYHSKLLDLYCGIGSIGIYLHDEYDYICGIEIIESAIKDARNNIKLNNIKNIEFFCEDAGNRKDNFETIIVDPPRNGLNKKVIENIFQIKPKQIIYVSCNPNTLKRDIELLNGYNLIDINYFELFPWTSHIECVCVIAPNIKKRS